MQKATSPYAPSFNPARENCLAENSPAAGVVILDLDLVISVDTAVAHLAGALGVPVWILIPFAPDWRWLREGETTAWYPSARLFRQEKWGDWDGVFSRVFLALSEKSSRPLPRRVPISLGLVDLVEMAVRAEIAQGSADEVWAILSQAGVPDTAEFARLTARLKGAFQEMEVVDARMRALVACPDASSVATDLVRRYVDAQQERADSLLGLSLLLVGDGEGRK